MAPRQKRAVIDDADWERVRPVIHRLYIKEGKPQRDILVTLGTLHDFHPSKAQLEWKLKQWRMVRNLASSEWKYVVNRIRKRQARGKESQVFLSGMPLRPATIDKARSRHCFETALEKTIKMPPPPSPKDLPLIIRTPSPVARSNSWRLQGLPHFQLQAMLRELKMFKTPPKSNLSVQHLTDKVFQMALRNQMFSTLAYTTKLQYTYKTLSLLMPEHPWGNHVAMAEGLLEQSSHDCNSGPFEVTAFLLSNNFLKKRWDNDHFSEVPTDLIDWVLGILRRTNLSTLGMPQNYSKLQASIQALLERLFKEAIQRSCLGDIRWLLQAGVDVNLPLVGLFFENKYHLMEMKPFEYATLVYNIPLVDLLIEYGADCRLNDVRTIFYPIERRLQTDATWLPSIKLMLSKYEFHPGDERNIRHILREVSATGRSRVSETVVEFFRGKLESEATVCQLLVTAIRTQSPLTMELLAEHIDHIDVVSTFKETPLTAAASEGNIELCAYLLRLGASLSPCSGVSDNFAVATPLQCAACFADTAMVLHLLDAGADPNDHHPCDTEPQHVRCIMGPGQNTCWDGEYLKTRYIGRTALQSALLGGKIENALLLLRKGALPIGGELAVAILNRQSSAIGHLIDTKASLMEDMPSSSESISILEASVVMGDITLIKDIINANPKAITPRSLSAAVWRAKATSDLITVKLLLARYAESRLPDDPWFGTVVSLAAALGLMEVVQTILGHGMRPASAVHMHGMHRPVRDLSNKLEPDTTNLRDIYFEWRSWISEYVKIEADYWPLINTAVSMGHQTYLDLLLHYGYKPTPLCAHFLSGGRDVNILRRLHEHGARMTQHVLAGTIFRGDSESTEWLLSLNLDLNEPGPDGVKLYWRDIDLRHSALQVAAQKGDMDLLDRLIRLGANVNAPPQPSRYGATALQFAGIQGYFGIVQKLLDLGANPNAPGAEINGRTALEGAAEHGRLDVLQLLLNSGAETEGSGQRQYVRAIAFARREGHYAAANLLRSHRPWTQADQDILEEGDLLHLDQSAEGIANRRGTRPAVQDGRGCCCAGVDDSVAQKSAETEDSGGEGLTTDTVEVDSSTDAFEEDPYGVDVYVKEAAVSFWEPVYDHLTWEIL